MKKELAELIFEMQERVAKAVILGCTDLSILNSSINAKIPIIDTTEILVISLVQQSSLGQS